MRSSLLIGIALAIATPAHAVRVALLENYVEGHLVQLEPEGRFAHVAIEVEPGVWLHAHPHPDVEVELTRDIERFGVNMEIFENPLRPAPTPRQIERYLGMTYDRRLEWNADDTRTYNARLVGELLGIPPRPAYYMAEIWGEYAPHGTMGLSPDDIHHVIVEELGFEKVECDELLARRRRPPDERRSGTLRIRNVRGATLN